MDVRLHEISSSSKQITTPENNSLVGFISPTHGFNFPPLMLKFIFRFPNSRKSSVFIINTRGGLKLSKFFVPGLSGLAQLFSAIVLKIKGYKIVGMRPIDLPSNWISLHPGLKPNVISSIYCKRKAQVHKFADKILSGRKNFRALYDIIQDLLIAPIAILYYFFGRFMFAKSFFASNECNNCNLCIQECPINAIKSIDNRPFWTYKCESCMHCMNACPKRAIETAHGFIAAMVFLFNSVIFYLIVNHLDPLKWFQKVFTNGVVNFIFFIFQSILFIGFFIFTYRIMHFLLRFRIFERVLVYTSLTQYKFWRRYDFKKIKNV